MKNEYIPFPVRIDSMQRESFDTITHRVVFEDSAAADVFTYKPGQFAEVSLPGIGEAPISITSSPGRQGYLEFTIRSAGKLTRAINDLKPGDRLYIRGPYGNSFPFEETGGKNLFFIAGGIGLPPLRSLINAVFENRKDFGRITILYGSKTPDELCFKEELTEWQEISETEVLLTVDTPDETWTGNIGVVTKLWDKTDMSPHNSAAFVCGPPVMIKFVIVKLLQSGFMPQNIFVTLERYMKCGIGKCGHCNIGMKFVCVDGPVFSYEQLKEFPVKEKAV